MPASSQKRSDDRLQVFVSYSRKDMALADAIVVALEGHGIEVKIDRRDLPYGQKWQAELADFIRAADTVVWLVSPNSVASKWCNWELGEVTRLNKRLVPVSIDAVTFEQLPEAIGDVHLLPAEGTFNLDAHIGLLVTALATDSAWLKDHTRLADRARQWLAKDRDKGLLLRGGGLADAEAWADRQPKSAPQPSDEILNLILSSRRAASRRQRVTVAAALGVAVLAGALGLFAELNRREANTQRVNADAQRQEATSQRDLAQRREREAAAERDRALTTESQFLAELSRQKARSGDVDVAALLALEALPHPSSKRPYVAEAERSLYGALHSRRLVFQVSGHTGDVNGAVFSRDGRLILTASADRTAAIWNGETGERLSSLEHDAPVVDARFMAGDARVLTLTDKGVLHFWDASSGRLLTRVTADFIPTLNRRPVASDGRLVIAGTFSGKVLVLDASNGRQSASIKAHKETVNAVALSGDGRRFVTTSEDATAAVWETAGVAANAAPLFRLTDKDGRGFVNAVFNADGSRLLTLTGSLTDWRRSAINRAQLWDQNGKLIADLKGHEFRITDAAFSPDGQVVATVAEDGTARLWSGTTGQSSLVLRVDGGSHVSFSPDSTRLLMLSNGVARVWLAASGREIVAIKSSDGDNGFTAAVFEPTGRRVIAASGKAASVWDATIRSPLTIAKDFEASEGDSESSIVAPGGQRILYSKSYASKNDPTPPTELWNGRTGSLLAKLEVEQSFVSSEFFSPDGRSVVFGCGACEKPVLKLLRADDGRPIATLSTEPDSPIAFSPDGQLLLTSQTEKGFLYEIASRRKVAALNGHTSEILTGVFRGDGERILTTSRDKTARLWETRTGRLLQVVGEQATPMAFASFAPQGGDFVTVSDRVAHVRSDATGQIKLTLEGHKENIRTARYSPVGARIVTASADRLAIVWDARSGTQLARLEGHLKEVTDAEFSPDGLRVLTHSADGSTRLWDSATGANIAVLAVVETGGNLTGHFAPNGSHVLIASVDHTTIALPVLPTTEALIGFAKKLLQRCLTPDERRQYNLAPDPPRWCIGGPEPAPGPDTALWKGKPPYNEPAWRNWLIDLDRVKTATPPAASSSR